jgi:hypothetical protein
VVALTLDPLRDPVLDRVGHEAAHVAALAWLGYSAQTVRFDFRWADLGFAGAIDGVRRLTGDPARESRDRAVIAAVGPLLGGTGLDHPSARADLRSVDANREAGWSPDAWRWLSTERARDLARHEPFAYTWRLLVVRLHDLGDEYVEFHGDEVDRFLEEATNTGSVLVG